MMDNVQKHIIFAKTSLSQTFRSLESILKNEALIYRSVNLHAV
jgi:hypothetical protein